ncbi:YbaK/EbsC family protein [Xanthobacteraceae bacterium Astr-EGSB]|uniref:YbaK/EbsC family protein n=1 Tax=Astrobacterium formosum TaxID=3069710 RepID=UPI0027B0226E|nr:YbaK/EbsC family protein [Xanthobacteraceae bacterium Astr-EGSB]
MPLHRAFLRTMVAAQRTNPMDTFERLVDLFRSGNASFRVIEHAAEGRSDTVAAIRGTRVEQGAKAIVCAIPVGAETRYVVAVVPGDRRVDVKAVARLVGGKKGSFAAPAVAQMVTGCAIGAIPPVSFDDTLALIVDGDFLDREDEIAFNAGRLDRSIVIRAADFRRIVQPQEAAIAV